MARKLLWLTSAASSTKTGALQELIGVSANGKILWKLLEIIWFPRATLEDSEENFIFGVCACSVTPAKGQ